MTTVKELAGQVGIRRACDAFSFPRSSYYRILNPVEGPARKHPSPRALSETEKEDVLLSLNSERFADQPPRQMYATLLDEGRYLCHWRTMYRILTQNKQVRERRNQLKHPLYEKPELLATAPLQLWSWDITKMRGPEKWSYYYLYVLLDVFSRYVVGYMVTGAERATLARDFIETTCERQEINQNQLTIHADRGLADDLQDGRPTAGGSRRGEDPFSASRLERQSLLRGPVQDDEVPGRLPETVWFVGRRQGLGE